MSWALPLQTRVAIGSAQLRSALGAKSGDGYFRIPWKGERLLVGRTSLDIDIETIREILAGALFDSDFTGRLVIDGGAHKGYYAALALERGARAVYSYEPECSNYDAVRATSLSSPNRDRWRVERLALSDRRGTATLQVSRESWAHSLRQPASGGVLAAQVVETRTLGSELARARDEYPEREIIVKLNIEGSAGTVLLATTKSDWAQVVDLWCEYEANEPHPREQIEFHLDEAGFQRTWQRRTVARYAKQPDA